MRRTISIIFLLLISTFSFTFSQVVIKEKVDINPNSNQEIVNSISYGGCSYDFFDSTSLQVRFIPSEIGPGDTAIVQMWIVSSSGYSYRYYDDNRDLLELSVTVIPSYGTLTRIDSTQYRFVAADTMSADSVNIKVNYENYNQACLIMKRNSNDTTSRKTSNLESGCIDCGRYGPSVLLHAYGSGEITIKKPKVAITLDKTIIDPKDTVLINLRCKNEDGSITDFPSGTKFEIGIIEGCDGGTLWAEGDTGAYLYNVSQPIKFIAKDDIQDDSLSIKIRAATIEGSTTTNRIALADGKGKSRIVDKVFQTNKKKNLTYLKSKTAKLNSENTIMKNSEQPNSKIEETQSNVCFGGEFQNKTSTDTTIKIVKNTILLGETKYYGIEEQVIDGELKKIQIKEITTKYGSKPEFPSADKGWTWVKKDIWGDDPIIFSGDKSAVYWEKMYPVFNDVYDKKDKLIGKNFKEMKNFSDNKLDGLIRIIGLFWQAKNEDENIDDYNKKYSVKLKVALNDKTTEINLRVVKPKTIGEVKDETNMNDVEGNPYNLDELILKYAGEHGIPPQIIKGDIEKESGFHNGYRWEPFFEAVNSNVHNGWVDENFMFWIKSKTDPLVPGLPEKHTNIFTNIDGFNEYWAKNYKGITIWDLFYNNCKYINPNATSDSYPPMPNIWPSKLISKYGNQFSKTKYEWIAKINKIYKHDSWIYRISLTFADIVARNYTNRLLKDKWLVNMNEIAQTRIASSYGLMQVLYTSAIDFRHYEKIAANLPENLNDKIISLNYGTATMDEDLNKEIKLQGDKSLSNWKFGFERMMEITLNAYNVNYKATKQDKNGKLVFVRYDKRDYAKKVLRYSNNYLPNE